jgi:hypothetical protein
MCCGSLFKVAPSAQAGLINQITAIFYDREREVGRESLFIIFDFLDFCRVWFD